MDWCGPTSLSCLYHGYPFRCYPRDMAEERPEPRSTVDEYVATLKSKIPTMEHGALESRVEELLNDPSADEDDVISILGEEFNVEGKR